MAFNPKYGLKAIKYADAVTASNTVPATLTEIPFTKLNTAVYKNTKDSPTKIEIEEQVLPLMTFPGKGDEYTFEFTSYFNDKQLLAALEGGTYTAGSAGIGAKYSPPQTPVSVHKFIQAEYAIGGGGVQYFNALISLERTGNFSKENLPEYNIKVTPESVNEGFAPIIEFDAPVA